MTYTPEQLREEGDARKALGHHHLASIHYDHAAALEELAALRAQLAEARLSIDAVNGDYIAMRRRAERAEAQLAERDAELAALKGHAEAMHTEIHALLRSGTWSIAANDYRAAYSKAECGCHRCVRARGGFPGGFDRMIVCEKCGNKRCPHANDHRNECTNSNAPGQPGSAYP